MFLGPLIRAWRCTGVLMLDASVVNPGPVYRRVGGFDHRRHFFIYCTALASVAFFINVWCVRVLKATLHVVRVHPSAQCNNIRSYFFVFYMVDFRHTDGNDILSSFPSSMEIGAFVIIIIIIINTRKTVMF